MVSPYLMLPTCQLSAVVAAVVAVMVVSLLLLLVGVVQLGPGVRADALGDGREQVPVAGQMRDGPLLHACSDAYQHTYVMSGGPGASTCCWAGAR